ncbi:MAG: hypothetical protein IJD42_06865 [Clostridia bacterium]|nr:hypothetical protein [Clostridia bacterium]
MRALKYLFTIISFALVLLACACGSNDATVCHHENIKTEDAQNATCLKNGLTEGKKCLDCGQILKAQESIKKIDHSYTLVKTTPACTGEGEATYKCDVCGEEYKEALEKTAHDLEFYMLVSTVSCELDGLEVNSCKSCGHKEEVLTLKLGHMLGEATKEIIGGKEYMVKSCLRDGCDYQEFDRLNEDTDDDTNPDDNQKPEPEPEEPTESKPIDQDITVIIEKTSEYIIVYERGNEAQKGYAEDLSKHIKNKYGVEIPVYQFGDASSKRTKRIVIGEAHANAKFPLGDIEKAGDFTVDVVEDDLFLVASTEYMYKYMIDIIKRDLITGQSKDELSFSADYQYVFSQGEYKDLNYAEYLKLKDGSFTYESLLNIFEARVHTAYGNLPYRIYVPSDYDSTKEYPLITILHGAGERGNDNKSQLKNLVVNLFNQKDSKYLDAIIICPQCPTNEQWVDTPWAEGSYSTSKVYESDELKAVIDIVGSVGELLSTDKASYTVMGLSMGGFGAWDMIMRHNDIFSKAVCLCGGADPSRAPELINVPIWIVHSSNDNIVPYSGSEEMYNAIVDAGGESCIFETKSSGHNVWGYAGDSEDIANWIFTKP